MNQTILFFLFFLFNFAITAHTQVTIDQNNFPRLAGFIDNFVTDRSFETLPSEGPNQIWDYSGLQREDTSSTAFVDATGDTILSEALNYRESFLFLQNLPIHRLAYDGIDENGFYQVGSAISEVHFSISTVSGGANDTMRAVGKKATFEGRIDFLQFPVTYEKQWTGSNMERIDFELTVGAFGLNKMPSHLKREETQTRTVVGYGKLIIPQTDGTPAAPVEVLLLKVEESYVDSFFVGGAPAPLALLDAFGFTQGMGIIAPTSRYVFYGAGFTSPLLAIDFTSGNENVITTYRPQLVTGQTTSIQAINWTSLKSYPNPVQAGNILNIQTKKSASEGNLLLSDISGRIVRKIPFTATSNNQFSIQIPPTTDQGLYIYQVYDHKGQAIGRGKLQVN